mmetsp:Transcript_35390/g.82401  ORF Transcript_35390/g.82401 Transcript_35390/m.82401 type:complete len:104 (-) Transcript_35390:50-361(-)
MKKILSDVDRSGTGTLTKAQFVGIFTAKWVEKDPPELLLKAFEFYDKDGTGFISLANLAAVAAELGEPASEAELREMIEEADQDKDGLISKEEFLKIMEKKRQ